MKNLNGIIMTKNAATTALQKTVSVMKKIVAMRNAVMKKTVVMKKIVVTRNAVMKKTVAAMNATNVGVVTVASVIVTVVSVVTDIIIIMNVETDIMIRPRVRLHHLMIDIDLANRIEGLDRLVM